MGAFFNMMSTSFAYEDPLSRTWQNSTMNSRQKTVQVFKDMGKGMWRSGKGFGGVGALYAGLECVIEGVSERSELFQLGLVSQLTLSSYLPNSSI